MIPVRVVADERERSSGVPEELSKLNVRVYFSKLSVADYVLSPEVAVERKRVSDLISSIYDSRIFNQTSRLASAYAKPYLLIEGDSKEVEKLTRNLKSYYGAIASVTLAYGLRVLFTANKNETAVAIAELLRNVRAKPITRQMAASPAKSRNISQQQLYLVSSLPGVGLKLARRLLLRYGTPRRVMSMTEGELSMMPGIGWRRAEKIKRVLDERHEGAMAKESQTKLE